MVCSIVPLFVPLFISVICHFVLIILFVPLLFRYLFHYLFHYCPITASAGVVVGSSRPYSEKSRARTPRPRTPHLQAWHRAEEESFGVSRVERAVGGVGAWEVPRVSCRSGEYLKVLFS